MENEIDIFHRILLRSILKIHYPYIISNDDLYSRTKEIPWSLIIKKRRFSWIGHMLRLPDEAPVKIALSECLESNRKKVGVGNKLTLIKAFNNQLIEVDNTLNLACETTKALAEDRGFWRKTAYGLAVVSTKDVNAEQ